MLRAEPALFGPVASDPVISRLFTRLAGDAPIALKAIRSARAAARERAWRLAGDQAPSLRWILFYLIEEYARHNGHADLIRELAEGSSGSRRDERYTSAMTAGLGSGADLAPERILVAGDWHGNRDWALNVIRRIPQLLAGERARLLLHLGDFGIWPGADGRRYLEALSAALELVDAELWFVDGNHEDFSQLDALAGNSPRHRRVAVRPGIYHLPRGDRWHWHDRTWLACGGGVSLDKAARTEGHDWWPQEEITHGQETALIGSGGADVMVCHDCPSGVTHSFPRPPSEWSPADLARNEAHRQRLQRIVDAVRPAHLMHGHLHRAYQRTCDLGYGPVQVTGLGTDGVLRNFAVLDVTSMAWQLRRRGLLDLTRRR